MTPEQIEKWRADFAASCDKTVRDCEADANSYLAERLFGYLAGREAETLASEAKIAELAGKTAVCMGVGNGSGQLFVYGDYDSIKAARATVLAGESARATITQLQAQLAAVKSGEVDEPVAEYCGYSGRFGLSFCRLSKSVEIGTKFYLKPQPAAQVPDDPVAWRSRHVNYVGWTLSEWELPMREGQEQQPLYLDRRCATIPDSLHMRDVTHPKATNPEEAWMYATGWNDCRAAMIEGEKK